MVPYRRAYSADARSSLPPGAEDYIDLHPMSLVLSRTRGRSTQPVVRLLLPLGRSRSLFAGMRTAVVFAARLASNRGLPLEICHFDLPVPRRDEEVLRDLASTSAGLPAERVRVRTVWEPVATNEDDVHVATFWETALAAQIAVRLGVVPQGRVLYLVQDYEPEFYAGSTESSLARSTYHAGFRMIVNSTPLAAYLAEREDLPGGLEHVFRPEIDLEGVDTAARSRRASDTVRIGFYGRPGNPRNSFDLGVATLKVASRRLHDAGLPAEFTSIGEKHPEIRLPHGRLPSLGKLEWGEYFRVLSSTDVMLSFQQTPHPSHPPLDAVASGAFAVMNDLAQSRSRMSPRLLANDAEPAAMADALVEASRRVLDGERLEHLDQDFVDGLGRSLKDVAADLSDLV